MKALNEIKVDLGPCAMTMEEIENYDGNSLAIYGIIAGWRDAGMSREAAAKRLIDHKKRYGPISGTFKDLAAVYDR